LPGYNKPHKYQQTFRCTPADYGDKIVNCPGIVYNCSCPRFTFTWNWAAWVRNASVLNATNERPTQTNPSLLIGGCKHIIIAMAGIYNRKM
jgi:hypothetical protein